MEDETKEPPEEQEKDDLNLYLRELIERQDHTLLTEKDMKQLDERYPLSQQEKDKVLMLSHRHVLRAEQSRRQERWDTAIVETERALLFTPLDLDLRLDLAELYILRSRQYGYLDKDLNRAAEKVRETLILKPGYKKAQTMQKELLGLNRMLRGSDQNKKFIPLVIALFLILGAVFYPRLRTFRFWNNREETETASEGPAEEADWSRKDLQVLTTESLDDKILLEVEGAELKKDERGYAVALRGYARTKNRPLKELTLQLSLGDILSPVLTKELPLLDENSPELTSQETLPFAAYFQMTDYSEGNDTVNLAVLSLVESDSPPSPEEWASLSPQWDIPRPDGVNLLFTGRKYQMLEGYDRMYLYQDIKLENRSRTDLAELEVTARWYDGAEQEIAVRTVDFVPPGHPPIRKESIQSLRVVLDLPKSAEGTILSPLIGVNRIEKEEEHAEE